MTFISVVRDFEMYERLVRRNAFTQGADFLAYDNRQKNEPIAVLYNRFLDAYDYGNEDWFIFCHEDWELKEALVPLLEKLNPDVLYGPVGAILLKTCDGWVREYRGCCHEKSKAGTNERVLIGQHMATGTPVDTFDCQCLIVHSSLIARTRARFDEQLRFDLYVEDFCLSLRLNHNVPSKILQVLCCHWSQVPDLRERTDYFKNLAYLDEKYRDHSFAGVVTLIGKGGQPQKNENCRNALFTIREIENKSLTYKSTVPSTNDPRRHFIDWIASGEEPPKILDVGCACGDLEVALKREKNARVWGMEYDAGSVRFAKATQTFEDVFEVDLNTLDPHQYLQFAGFFDYILLGDVLEHLMRPGDVLEKLKLFLKDGGMFLISLPNIAHASIKADLLLNRFIYTKVGILDRTHLRFFTHVSIPPFLAEAGLEITEVRLTGMGYQGLQPECAFPFLDAVTRKTILNDVYSYVCQFVMKCAVPHGLTAGELNTRNKDKLQFDWHNAPAHIKKLRCKARFRSTPWGSAMRRALYHLLAMILRGKKKAHYLDKLRRYR